VERKTVTIDEIVATFSSHLSTHYPPPEDFRRNFDLLLKGKRDRADEAGYSTTLEKNIVFLSDLVGEAEKLVGKLLAPAGGEEVGERGIPAALEEMEKKTHEKTARRHREVFVEEAAGEFGELRADRAAGGPAYIDKLEFNYRYLMTLRIFLFEFIAVLAAIRVEYSISDATSGSARAIRDNIELMAHYYLGNVAVGAEEKEKP
jgi:hypothetical protein